MKTLALPRPECHNVAVTVWQDAKPDPSNTPIAGSDQCEVANQPKGGFIDLSRTVEATDTKSKPQTIREFESALRDLGFSKRESKAIASNGFKAIFPTQQLDEQINALADSLAKYRNIFES
jgi:hypothetical protein